MATEEQLDGLCAYHRKLAVARRVRVAAREARVDPLPPATCTVSVEAHRAYEIRVSGELTREGWERVGDALAERVGHPLTQLDLRGVVHARSMSARVASYLGALVQGGSRVVVYASRYVQACLCASKYGASLAVEWRLP